MKKLLIIGFVWPEPNSSAAGSRMMQLIAFFQSQGYAITVASPAQNSNYSIDLSKYGVEAVIVQLNHKSFDDFVKAYMPDIVLFDRFMIEEQFGWRVAKNCPQAIRILDTEDLHCLRLSRQRAFKNNTSFCEDDLLLEEVSKREIASILRCDLSFIISEYEMTILQSLFKIEASLLCYLPFLSEAIATHFAQQLPSYQEREGFVFVGNFLHEPNWNAVQYLKETIWPQITKKLPRASLKIYGAYPSQKVMQLHEPKANFLIMGRAENVQQIVQKARIVLAPLRFGAGIKGKLIEAMQCGTPSITTSIGAEAMQGNLPWNGFVVDAVDGFVNSAINLYNNQELWQESQQNGFVIVNQRFSKVAFEKKLTHRLTQLLAEIDHHRKQNFIGAMLHHHTLNSTKYMSKWIEAKTK